MATSYTVWVNILTVVGRILFSLIFVISGFHKLMTFSATASMMAGMGVPNNEIMLVIAILFELGGGLLVLLGWYTRFGAFLLFLFMIPVTFVFHSFWNDEGAQMLNNIYHFLKNLSMMGATLYLMSFGAGKISIDGLFRGK